MRSNVLAIVGIALSLQCISRAVCSADDHFQNHVAPILQQHCVRCHSGSQPEGEVSLVSAAEVIEGLADGWVVTPGKPDESRLIEVVSGDKPEMPKQGERLTADQVAVLRKWIADGAKWPEGIALKPKAAPWWSLEPLARPAVPTLDEAEKGWTRTPVDAFIRAKQREHQLAPSPEADRRTLIRRLYFDLVGLPPTPEEIDQFVADEDPAAYAKLVDRLLDSPQYGERWARHWLDIVHYGDTHGYDKDKLRPNAWPYRDYVIRALNNDLNYTTFVKQQLAGDVFSPDSPDGIVALGFISAGPFDWVGHIEVSGASMEGKRVRNLDRDDMVTTTMNTFSSFTAQCARCHNHKFDPITQEDYYSLQAVFAAVDRADREYDLDPSAAAQRVQLAKKVEQLQQKQQTIHAKVQAATGPELNPIDGRLAELAKNQLAPERPEFGYHSQLASEQNQIKWVQIDLGKPTPIAHLVYVACHDDFGSIGAGFGFPVRYKIEVSDDPTFAKDVTLVVDHTAADVPNPKVTPQSAAVGGKAARYVRFTATKLAERVDAYIFALAELSVLTPEGSNAALGAAVTSLDSIEAGTRWGKANLVDGYYYGVGKEDHLAEIAKLNEQRDAVLAKVLSDELKVELAATAAAIRSAEQQLQSLPRKGIVYAAATRFAPQGNFANTGGKPREIYILKRGEEKLPDIEHGQVVPHALSALEHLAHHFDLPERHDESQRRAALAAWMVDRENPLTWRSIVNRVWQYHFGRGIVDTPNDFGRMGGLPSHPELLDWLAVEFRDGGQSLKSLHRLILNSAVYRQASTHHDAFAKIDGGNQYLWRMNRQRLEAEAIRDAVLKVAGKLDEKMGGPGFRAFGFKDDHSPHYKYREHDPDDVASHRRSIYRFIVRSVPDPFMTTLDCADPTINVAKRNETLTALQALALLNNKFIVRMSEHFAARADALGTTTPEKIDAAYRLALGRLPADDERAALVKLADETGLANACRVILNLNEFVFID